MGSSQPWHESTRFLFMQIFERQCIQQLLFSGGRLPEKSEPFYEMNTIKSKYHELGTCRSNKISLPCFNDKRYIFDDGIKTLSYGYEYIC